MDEATRTKYEQQKAAYYAKRMREIAEKKKKSKKAEQPTPMDTKKEVTQHAQKQKKGILSTIKKAANSDTTKKIVAGFDNWQTRKAAEYKKSGGQSLSYDFLGFGAGQATKTQHKSSTRIKRKTIIEYESVEPKKQQKKDSWL